MGRIRLQICVLPCEPPWPSSSSSPQSRQETLKWCEPCPDDTPMEEICDRISRSWKKIFEGSMGPLQIRHLKTAYGDFLDLEERVVGDFFDDRGADGNIRNSILEVHRYPPTPDELGTLPRFSSLAPNSSARPRKRPLELPSQSYSTQSSRDTYRAIPSIEEEDAEINNSFGAGTKRQRTHESRLNRKYDAHQTLITREEKGSEVYHSSQTSAMQGSIHQVVDSQKSPGKKHSTPYGTPTSLPFVGLQEPIISNEIDLSAIPDSPLGRDKASTSGAFGRPMRLDRESTKSESPELPSSVHDLSPTDTVDVSGEQLIASASSPKASTPPFTYNAASKPVSIAQIVDDFAENHGLGARQRGEKAADVNRTPKHRSSTVDPVFAQNVKSNGVSLPESDPIFDPIESDTESFHEKQQMQSVKRLKLRRTPTTSFASLPLSNKTGSDRRDGHFLVPSVPQSRTNGIRKSFGENTSAKQQTPRQDPTDADMTIQNGLKRHAELDAQSSEDQQRESRGDDQLGVERGMPKESIVRNDPLDAAQTSSQATTAWSQDSNHSASGTAETTVQQRDDRMSDQNQEPDATTQLHDTSSVDRNPNDSGLTQESEALAEEAEEPQRIMRTAEEKAKEKRLAQQVMEKGSAASKEKIAERAADEDIAVNNQSPRNDKAGTEESVHAAETASATEEELAEAKRVEETRANEVRLSEEKKASERLARERQTRETLLAKEANKVMLAADGAKQIKAEKNEIKKARLEELAAQKQANEAKATEQAREAEGKDLDKKAREERLAQERAQKQAAVQAKEAKDRAPKAKTVQETATTVREQAQRRLADHNAEKLRESSEALGRACKTLSLAPDVAGPKRSMTPHIPGSSVTTSSLHQSSLGSSPLSNRSPGSMGAPLRSALRQTPSSLRRSVSSVSFDVPPRVKLNEYLPQTPIPKSLKEINNELAPSSTSAPSLPKTMPRPVSNTTSKTPIKPPIPRQASDGKATKTPAKNGKVQTKLNVTRQKKKLKGRAIDPPIIPKPTPKPIDPPIIPKPTPKQEIVLSSGEDSSSSEEEVWQTGNAEAGPSSRKPAVSSQGKKIGEVKSIGTSIDPIIRNIKIEKDSTTAPATLTRSSSTLDKMSLQKSTSRSPAMALSETITLSSGSASRTSSDSDSDSESDSGRKIQAPSLKTPTGAKNGKLAPVTTNGVSKAVTLSRKQTEGNLKSKASSQSSSQAPSSPSRASVPMHGDGKHVDKVADKQLQLESRQSVPKSRASQASSTTKSAVNDKIINQGLDHAGRLPNGIRPAYYKYPGLSELQKLPRPATPQAEPKKDFSSSMTVGASPAEESGSDESSSESDNSSNTSDEGEEVDVPSSQTRSEKKSRPYPGLSSLIKLAASTFGSARE